MNESRARHVHLIGIGGAGFSALAKVLLGRGYVVSGSDNRRSRLTEALEAAGAKIYIGHAAEHITGADLVVMTSAAQADNPEVAAAHLQKIPVVKRREFLREVTDGYDTIAVAGSHGKTTTTALIASMLTDAGLDPTVVIGGIVPEWDSNARVGQSQWFVIEADEYDYAFLGLEPQITVLTNVDYDHPDLFATREAYQETFGQFLKQTRANGVIVVCGDEAVASRLAYNSGKRVVRYGLGGENEWRATKITPNALGGSDFTLYHGVDKVGRVALWIPGQHSVLNGLAAVAATTETGVTFDQVKVSLERFSGVERRFQVRGSFNGAVVIDDYAHHPTELRATLQAARSRYPQARIWALFQPHTFTRTRALLDDFADALNAADQVIVTEIYAAREHDATGLSAQEIVRRMKHGKARFIPTLEEAQEFLRANVQPGDVVLALGAGTVTQVAEGLSEQGNA